MPNQNEDIQKSSALPPAVLVLGGTGRSGALVAQGLAERGLHARTAARSGADVKFDWDDVATYGPALAGADRVYLVTPVGRTKFVHQVAEFFDLATAAGVRHVTYLSAYASDKAPAEIEIYAVERELARRTAFSHSILRPAWVMQNFSDQHLPLIGDAFIVPTGGQKEAFVDAHDIAAVAIETLIDPEAHAGALYSPTGPEALTVAEVAEIVSSAVGRPIVHADIDADAWINGAVEAGFVPADYAVMLRWLTGTIISGNGATPNGDVEKVTGRPATSFRDFAMRHAAAWSLQPAG
ncbi:NmrA family NAD(P)-binding protein [Methylocella sp.]|uniref:NmrA family NAD(P)-binding protein n=1 Tax=Methylocella sp. TaxID=1978226 RepID=UPI003783AF08